MKKFALTAVALAVVSGSAFAKVDMNPDTSFGKPHPENVYVAKNGSTVVLHKQGVVQVVDGEGNSTFHVAEKSQSFRDIDGKVVHIQGAGHHAADIQAGLDKFLEESQNGSNNGQGSGDVVRPMPGNPTIPDLDDGQEIPNSGEGDVNRPMPPVMDGTNDDGMGHTPMPDFGNNGSGSDEDSERPYPGTGEGSVERPRPGAGSSVERPKPNENAPVLNGMKDDIKNNSNNIAAMGEAFEQRVDAVNGYLSQAGQAIANNSTAISGLQQSFEAQAAHTTKEIARLDGRIDALEEKTDKMKAGIAGATAIATLSQYHGEGQHHFAFGIGAYDGEQAMAAGYTYAFDDKKTTIRATLALDSQSDVAMGASIGHSW